MYKIMILIALLGPMSCLAAELVDPTKPASYSKNAEGSAEKEAAPVEVSWMLNSILISPQRKVAVINGKQVAEGGMIDDYQVKKIDTYQVVLAGGTEEKILTLGSYRLEKQYRQSEIGAPNE